MYSSFQKILFGVSKSIVIFAFGGGTAWTGRTGDLKSLVPPEHMEQGKSFNNPFPITNEFIGNRKRLYEGKGWCAFCHGWEDRGKPEARRRIPPDVKMPTNFADAAWQRARSDGGTLLGSDTWQPWY